MWGVKRIKRRGEEKAKGVIVLVDLRVSEEEASAG